MGEAKRKLAKAREMLKSYAGVQTAGGRVRVRWEADSAATPMGQLDEAATRRRPRWPPHALLCGITPLLMRGDFAQHREDKPA